MNWGRTDPQLDVYVPSAVSPSVGLTFASPSRHQPIAFCDPGCSQYPSPVVGINPVQTIRLDRAPSDSRIYQFRSLDPSKKIFRIFRATPVFPYPCPSRIHHPIHYTRTQSWSPGPNCSGYGSWITITHQEQLIPCIQSTGPREHPLRAALKPKYIASQTYNPPSVGGDYLPENST